MALPDRIGRYRVLGLLGQGAMGVVYRGRDEALDRDVALKLMSSGPVADKESRERFLREARAAAKLQHPNIITIYELGEHEGSPFMALELLDGVDLQRAIEAGLRPDPKVTLPIVLQLLAGLGHAHEHGIVHRDVKPSNVFLPRGRPAKIMDFGVARLGVGMTTAGMVVGTPNYMSPEQVRGGALDGRSDVFSAGLILYELVTGEKAYKGDTVVALLYKIAHEDPDLSILPRGASWEGLRAVLARALARDPDERYTDAAAMIGELERALLDLGGSGNWALVSDAGLLVRTGPRPSAAGPVALGTAAPPADSTPVSLGTAPPPASAPVAPPRHVSVGFTAGLGIAAVAILGTAVYVAMNGLPDASPPPPSPAPAPPASPIVASPVTGPTTTPGASPTPARPVSAAPGSPAPASPVPASPGSWLEPSPKPSPVAPSAPPLPAENEESSPADARLDRAESLYEQGRYAAAMKEAKAVLAREPRNVRAKELVEDAEVEVVVETRIKEAEAALKRGDVEGAQEAAKAGLVVKPTDARLLRLWREATQ